MAAEEPCPRPITVGVAGGSGSGKTTIARILLSRIGEQNIAYLPHDSYYHDLQDLPGEQHGALNFDHPDSLDTDLFIKHIRMLQSYQVVPMPVYDFAKHKRTDKVQTIHPARRVCLHKGSRVKSDPGANLGQIEFVACDLVFVPHRFHDANTTRSGRHVILLDEAERRIGDSATQGGYQLSHSALVFEIHVIGELQRVIAAIQAPHV